MRHFLGHRKNFQPQRNFSEAQEKYFEAQENGYCRYLTKLFVAAKRQLSVTSVTFGGLRQILPELCQIVS